MFDDKFPVKRGLSRCWPFYPQTKKYVCSIPMALASEAVPAVAGHELEASELLRSNQDGR